MTTLVSLLIVLGVLIFVHELGHFLAAKWAGIWVHRFSLGLGSPVKALSFRRGETEYAISWLPLGGYVKMASAEEEGGSSALEGEAPAVEVPPDRMFESKPVWKRMVVILAGVTMNALFAYLVFAGLAWKNGRQLDPETRVGTVVDELMNERLRPLEGLQPGDRIVSVSGRPVASWNDVMDAIANVPGDTVTIATAAPDTVRLVIPSAALEDRLKASLAVLPYREPVVGQVLPGKPAERAGIQPGDTVVALDGRRVGQWYDMVELLNERGGREISALIGRDGARRTLRLTPELESVPAGDSTRQVGRIGVGLEVETVSEPYTVGGALAEGWDRTVATTSQIVRSVQGLLTGQISGRQLGGPILIGQMAGQSARLGLDTFLEFMALISVNLAVLNMLPIPVLDGGQFLFLLGEAVLGRPLPARLRERLTMVGLVIIVLLMVFAFSNDIMRLIGI